MFKAPTQTPSISTLLDDLSTTDKRKIARHLGVTENTVRRWAKTNNAPRLAHLALFWESRWGLSVLDCDIWNRDTLRLQTIRSLQDSNAALRRQIAHLVNTGRFGAANDPLYSGGGAHLEAISQIAYGCGAAVAGVRLDFEACSLQLFEGSNGLHLVARSGHGDVHCTIGRNFLRDFGACTLQRGAVVLACFVPMG